MSDPTFVKVLLLILLIMLSVGLMLDLRERAAFKRRGARLMKLGTLAPRECQPEKPYPPKTYPQPAYLNETLQDTELTRWKW